MAPIASAFLPVSNLALKFGHLFGFDKTRRLPNFQKPYSGPETGDVLLFADTFNRHFDPETLHAAERVIAATGKTVGVMSVSGRPLCCGRTYLSAGQTDRAKQELQRSTDAFRAALDAGKTIVGLEPSCTLMFRDEAVNMIPEWSEEHGAQILTFAEYIMQNPPAGLDMSGLDVLVHGHCHQKALGVAQHTVDAVKSVLGANAQMIDSTCCGMAGSFGYQSETAEVSREMAELSLAPTVRAAPKDTVVLADGFSCRCQIKDVTKRKAMNLALLMDKALKDHGTNH
jgi:Fe-S oxidoreductase